MFSKDRLSIHAKMMIRKSMTQVGPYANDFVMGPSVPQQNAFRIRAFYIL